MKTKVEDQSSMFHNVQNLKMSETAPVPINSDTPKTENSYQSPPPAVFNWNTVAEVKQDNASSMFAQNNTSAANFLRILIHLQEYPRQKTSLRVSIHHSKLHFHKRLFMRKNHCQIVHIATHIMNLETFKINLE